MFAVAASPADAAPAVRRDYHIGAQDLGSALRAAGRTAGAELMFASDTVAGKRTVRLDGSYTTEEALTVLLAGTGLHADVQGGVIFIRGRDESPSSAIAATPDAGDIIVTGSRIRGTPIASPVISQSAKQIADAGLHTLGDFVRSLPQNFSGGQNPAVGFTVPYGSGENNGGGTAINLRGLGPDATLTLLNGHRLAYGSTRQTVDISAIPLAALDRIEIVADGASALYGSDAVGGVANILLKPDYQGLTTTARVGGATDGGDMQQQYSAVGGTTWRTGGFLVAYDFGRSTAITADQRSYSRTVAPGLTLLPSDTHHSVVLAGHQLFAPGLTFSVDAIYNWRHSSRGLAFSSLPNAARTANPSTTDTFAVSPKVELVLSPAWTLTALGTYGIDRIHYGTDYITGGTTTPLLRACTCNTSSAAELNVEGSLFALPGGAAKIALGGGYRTNRFRLVTTIGTRARIDRSQDTYYAFGELNLPIVSPAQEIGLVSRLNVSAALRYERYPNIDDVFTPKLGIVYSPVAGIDLKGSWGRSFKAPTLYQQYVDRYADLYTAASRGGVGYAPTATALLLTGGSTSLKPERATTWAATVDLHPAFAPRGRLQIDYYDIRYRNRVVTPIAYVSQALGNPIYRDLVNFSPTGADRQNALSGRIFDNYSGLAFNAANIAAIIDDDNVNAASQHIQGIDVFGDYRLPVGNGSITLSGDVTYLKSRQQLSDLQPVTDLAGTLFNPPHYRARGGAVGSEGPLTLGSFLNYIGGVKDVRPTVPIGVKSMTTLDLAASYRNDAGPAIVRGVEIALSLQNAFNAKPRQISTTAVYETPYDSTNYSPVGRLVSLSVTKNW